MKRAIPHFLDRVAHLETLCRGLRILKPSALVAELAASGERRRRCGGGPRRGDDLGESEVLALFCLFP
jgi:hypothetical protein